MIRKFYDVIPDGERKGGTRKIKDFPSDKQCIDSEHNPPTMIVLEPGIYEHECPSCHNVQTFIIPPKPTL